MRPGSSDRPAGTNPTTATTGWGVTVSEIRSMTPGAEVEDPDAGGVDPLHHLGHRGVGPPLGGHVDRFDRGPRLQRHRQQLGALHHQRVLRLAQAALAQELPDPADPMMGEGESGLAQEPASALAGAAASASVATRTREANASGSVTARSASTLRSTSTSARWRPAMKRL